MRNAALLVDLGTTNCRVWLTQGEQILARAQAQVGVRDTARDGSSHRLRETLRSLIESASGQTNVKPSVVIAAGMIGSSLGLAEVPHVPAPAGLAELAAAIRRHEFPDITPLSFLLVPGVRTGLLSGEVREICDADLMRGEETLCIGLIASGRVRGPATILNLGSHWKTIQIDEQCRVARSITSLSGELIHATQTATILASAVPQERPAVLDPDWIDAGMSAQRESGLARALFCVRLLEQAGRTTDQQRMAFLIGAFIAADLDALIPGTHAPPENPVVIVGTAALAQAWRDALTRRGIAAVALTETEVEAAFLQGLTQVLSVVPAWQ